MCVFGSKKKGKKKEVPAPKAKGRWSLFLAIGGTMGIILFSVIKGDYKSLPAQLTGWFTGAALAWAILGRKRKG